MAGEKDLLNKLATQARSFDEDALAAFANKGLLRRARKDFEADGKIVQLESADEATVKLRAAEAVVTLNEKGLTEAVCDCPATEVCRHILLAAFWLKSEDCGLRIADCGLDSEPPAITESAIRNPQSAIEESLADLEKAAGKKIFAQAVEFLQKNADCRISQAAEGIRLVEFLDANISVRLIDAATLSGHLCSCRSQDVCRHKVAAVLAWRRENGLDFLPVVSEKAVEALKLTPAQIRVLRKTQKLFEEFIEIGTAHLSSAAVEQLRTLATSAGGASLFRLSFAAKSLADGLDLSLRRSAQADETAWLIFLAKTYALCAALLTADAPNPRFIGASRTSYEEIGSLELAGVGAYQWQTLSGFHGVSILFWDDRAKRFFSWTDARPKSDASFTPANCFVGEMRWQGFASPAQASTSIFKLQNAARNWQNRLSGSGQIRGFVSGATDVEKLDFGAADFSDWEKLRDYFAEIFPCGLRERETFREFVVVRPQTFGGRFFDSTTQIFVWQVLDANRNALEIKIPFNSANETAINALEKVDAAEIKGVLTRLAMDAGELYLQPISLFLKSNRILHLNLSGTAEKQSKAEKAVENEIEIGEDSFITNAKGAISQRIWAGRETLQNLAEGGTSSAAVYHFEKLSQMPAPLEAAGLTHLAEAVKNFVKLPKSELPANLLRLIFLFELSLEIAQRR